jgi:hypothetical protein
MCRGCEARRRAVYAAFDKIARALRSEKRGPRQKNRDKDRRARKRSGTY